MQKIVVGIIAVFFVQLGFQAYLAVDRINADYRASAATESVTPEATYAPDIESLYTASKVVINDGDEIAASRKPVPRRADLALERPAPARPTTLVARTVPPPSPSAPFRIDQANYRPLSAEIREPARKRSFFSKTLSVLKKPYDWAKAVAGKIN